MNVVKKYGWLNNVSPDSCNYVAPKILSIIKNISCKRVIDIGSGNGSLAGLFFNANYYVAGVEYDKDGIKQSRLNHPKINFYNLGVQDNPRSILLKEKYKFDLAVSTEVIEHLFSPHLLPIFAKKVLRPGGYLVISTPYHGYLKNLLLSLFNKWDDHHTSLWHGGHVKFWSKNTLTDLLEDNGFKVVNFYGAGRLPFLWKSMILVAKVI